MKLNFVYFFFSVIGGASVQRRNTYENPPCFLNDVADPVGSAFKDCVQLYEYLANIKRQIIDMKFKSERLLEIMATKYCIKDESARFMHVTETNILEEKEIILQNVCSNTNSFLETISAHYDMLNELANYFEYLRETAYDNYSRELIQSFQGKIYECMCSIKMVLRAGEQDPYIKVPSGSLSPLFIRAITGSVCDRQTAQYISVLDGNRIATYLESIYSRHVTDSQ